MKKIIIGILLCLSATIGNNVYAVKYDGAKLFPSWEKDEIAGIIGENETAESDNFILNYVPKIIDILLKVISPVIFGMFVFAGMKFIYAGEDEEQLQESKKFFAFALLGLTFIITSYSLMKAVYYILAG
ncbi:MAG: hypothetical protein OEL89_03820 [Candidatus Peregrinibacteria bacterium]|nr:hypothetical protein [Candidatus Peregrinibacteria bacterium]